MTETVTPHDILNLNTLRPEQIPTLIGRISSQTIDPAMIDVYAQSPPQDVLTTLKSSLEFLVVSNNQFDLVGKVPGMTPENASKSLQGAMIRLGAAIYAITTDTTTHTPFSTEQLTALHQAPDFQTVRSLFNQDDTPIINESDKFVLDIAHICLQKFISAIET